MTKTFESRVAELQDTINSFAYQLTTNRDDALDLSQETMLRALDNKEKFNEGTNLKAWLFTIMRNTFINNYRRQVRSATIIDKSDNLYHLNIEQECIQTPEGTVSMYEINKCIDKIPIKFREVFNMFVVGYKYTEIAEKTKLPLGTVKSQVFHARQILQEMLKDYKN